MNTSHPAKYSDVLLPIFAEELQNCSLVLDPFGGVGKLKQIRPDAIVNEIEFEWAKEAGGICGDALRLPFADETFDAICTSPTYGNRMADHHNAKDGSRRITYKHCLGHDLHPNNSGQLQWGNAYKEFHKKAWKECYRVLKPKCLFVLNISDHIRDGKQVDVMLWHFTNLMDAGFMWVRDYCVDTPRMRRGANSKARVEYEWVIVMRRDK